ncbi:MAG: hypothetical protein NVS2B12_28060 [Ktedonobacteraceae bacterium]
MHSLLIYPNISYKGIQIAEYRISKISHFALWKGPYDEANDEGRLWPESHARYGGVLRARTD